MATLIDWHAHHTAPEVAERIGQLTGKKPKIDDYDSPELAQRVKDMDAVGIDMQLICQGAGIYADQLSGAQALEIMHHSNDVLAQRIAPHKDRLGGIAAISLKNIPESVNEIERMAKQGFRAVLMYPHVDGEMLVDTPAMEPLYAKINELKMPIFLHGAGTAQSDSLKKLEDGGAGVAYAVLSDGEVAECCLRMIASGVFDRHPDLQIVIRSSGGGLPLLLHRFYWKHKGPQGEQKKYSEIFLEHFQIDCAGSDPTTLQFLIHKMGEKNVVFGSDFCGGLGPLSRGLNGVNGLADPNHFKNFTAKNSSRLLHL